MIFKIVFNGQDFQDVVERFFFNINAQLGKRAALLSDSVVEFDNLVGEIFKDFAPV